MCIRDRGAAREQVAGQLWQAFAQDVPLAPLCFKRGSLLLRWGTASGVQPTQADPFWNMEDWQITGASPSAPGGEV